MTARHAQWRWRRRHADRRKAMTSTWPRSARIWSTRRSQCETAAASIRSSTSPVRHREPEQCRDLRWLAAPEHERDSNGAANTLTGNRATTCWISGGGADLLFGRHGNEPRDQQCRRCRGQAGQRRHRRRARTLTSACGGRGSSNYTCSGSAAWISPARPRNKVSGGTLQRDSRWCRWRRNLSATMVTTR